MVSKVLISLKEVVLIFSRKEVLMTFESGSVVSCVLLVLDEGVADGIWGMRLDGFFGSKS